MTYVAAQNHEVTRPALPRIRYQTLVNIMFWIFISTGSVVVIEPSPYDFLWMITVALWVIG